MRVVGFHAVGDKICSSDEEFTTEDYLGFLLKDRGESINVFYNLDWAVARLCYLLNIPENQLQKFWKTNLLYVAGHQLFFIKHRYLSIKFGRHFGSAEFTDISQYDQGLPFEVDPMDAAKKAQEIGQRVYDVLTRLELHPTTLSSPIAAYQKEILSTLDLPKPEDIPPEAQFYAHKCLHGGWMEAQSIGHYPRAWDYDLNCYSGDTEVLTYDGWKPLLTTKIGDQILTFNKTENLCEFEPIQQLHVSNYMGSMVHIHNSHMDVLVTPNHRMIYKQHQRSKDGLFYKTHGKAGYNESWEVKEAGFLHNGNIRIPISYPMSDRLDYPIPDAFIRILAWLITEGFRAGRGRAFSIGQSMTANPEKCQMIENDLKTLKLNHKPRIYVDKRYNHTLHTYYINVKSSKWFIASNLNKDDMHLIPLWILHKLSIRQMKMFIDTLLLGDGSSKSEMAHCFYTNLEVNAKMVMYLCQLVGYRSFISCRYVAKTHKIRYHTNILKSTGTYDLNYGYINYNYYYNGVVSCPTVNNGFIVVQRNGKPFISGNSAFSYHTANLIDTRFGTWFKSDKFYSPSNVPYGFCKGIVDVEKDFNSVTYTHKNKDGDMIDYTPVGERPDYLTNAHIRELYDNGEGRFKLENAWYWKPDGELVYPLREHIERLFGWKQYLKGFERDIIKRILVGFTGKLTETFTGKDGDRVPGKLYNLPWYSWVQDQTKLQVANFVIQNHAEDDLLSIEVDGLKFSREIPIKSSEEMGDWRLNMVAPAFIVSSGVGCIQGKEGKGAFALKYDWLKSQIAANPDAQEYILTKLSPVTIGNALKNHKLDKLGELEMSERAVVLSESKRMYEEYPIKGSDLLNQYKSKAMDISILEKEGFVPDKVDVATIDLATNLTTP